MRLQVEVIRFTAESQSKRRGRNGGRSSSRPYRRANKLARIKVIMAVVDAIAAGILPVLRSRLAALPFKWNGSDHPPASES